MKQVQIAELKDQLSKHLRAVEQGAEIEVTDRRRPIAHIVPVRQAAVRLLPARRPFAALRRRRYRPGNWKIDTLNLLLEERRER